MFSRFLYVLLLGGALSKADQRKSDAGEEGREET